MKNENFPLGIRNNNPGNIEHGEQWQGRSDWQMRSRFVQFKEPKWGIRAIARILITYQDHRMSFNGTKIDTIEEIIERWAPPFENPTSEYVGFISRSVDVAHDATINVYDYETMKGLVKAIIQFENGMQPYPDHVIDEALVLAGIEVPKKPLTKSRTVAASSVVVAASLTEVAVDLEAARQALEPLAQHSDTIRWVMLAITVVAAGVAVWARIDDRNKGKR